MNELEKALAQLQELGASPQEMEAYTREFMTSRAAPADATSALQRERPDVSGDMEAGMHPLKVGMTALSLLPIGRGAQVTAKATGAAARRAAPHLVEAFPSKIQAMGRAARAVFQRPPKLPQLDDALSEVVEQGAAASRGAQRLARVGQAPLKRAPRQAEGFIGNSVDNLKHAGSSAGAGPPRTDPLVRRLEEAIEEVANKAHKPRSAPKARFDYFAERMAKRQASGEVAELSLEDMLALSLEHAKKGGSLKSASDALKIVRQK